MADETPISSNEGQVMANGTQKAVGAVKVGAKLASQNYVGAAKDVAVNFGKEIVLGVVGIILVLVIIITSVFSSGPSLVFHKLGDWLNDKTTEITFHLAENTIVDQFQKAEDDCYNDIIKNIQDGYIENFNSHFKTSFFNIDSVKTNGYEKVEHSITGKPNEYYLCVKEKNTNNLLFIYTVGAPEDQNPVTRVVRVKNAYNASSSTMDTLYFVMAYSIYHQTNNVGDDAEEGYTEPEDAESRWNEVETKGLKKFLKDHRTDLVSASYDATKETVVLNLDNVDVTREAEVLNVTIHTANVSDVNTVNKMFNLSEDNFDKLNAYYAIATELLR